VAVSTNVRMTVEWLVPLGQARPITMALHSLSADIRTSPGCAGSSVSTSQANGIAVRYIEDWETEGDLREHLRSVTFRRLIALVDGAIHPPRIEFTLPGGVRGLDYVVEVQRSHA